MSTFDEFLQSRLDAGGFTTEDALASFLPLVRQVVRAHESGRVAPLRGTSALQVDGAAIRFEESGLAAPHRSARVGELDRPRSHGVDVVGEVRITADVGTGLREAVNLQIGSRGEDVTRPVYRPGYVSWEHALEHHDPLTDVFSLGLLLASLACGLDFHDTDDLEQFVRHRDNLFALAPGLHPVLAKAVVRMTELSRHRRPQDLAALLHNLENYRDQEVDLDYDLARLGGVRGNRRDRRLVVLAALQQRLFEITRRNRLLHFRATMNTVNLTWASVPLSFHVESIRPDQILTWTDSLRKQLAGGKPLNLNRHLRFDEALYLPSALEHIRAEVRRDEAEFGFAQLRLVLCFLRWSNLKERPHERFDSPLVLLPVRLVKKKGVRDAWLVEPQGSEAEVNPVLRHYLRQLYALELPETIDLATHSLDVLYDALAGTIQASEPAVEIAKIDRPRIRIVHTKARRRLDQYRRRARLAGTGGRSLLDVDYSYDPDNFQPLGLALYRARVQPPEAELRSLVQSAPRPRTHMARPAEQPRAVPPAAETERQLYSLTEDGGANPYHWEFDLCSVTLGSFRYRKMSLVRDYAALLDNGAENPAFDAIFSLAPRPADPPADGPPPLKERYAVVPCDPTQASAIAFARRAASYIIQGPPGTGKSQTITNLIADYVARGRRVLFVCEKRAAIDVVYHRLRQTGLHPLCCLIHDSQADKKEFIQDLKQTYESFLVQGDAAAPPRDDVLAAVARDLDPLKRYSAAMCSVPPSAGLPLRRLLDRAVALQDDLPQLSPLERERIPDYRHWVEHADAIARLRPRVRDLQPDGVLARHPLSRLSPRLAGAERPVEAVATRLAAAGPLLDELDSLDGLDGWEPAAPPRAGSVGRGGGRKARTSEASAEPDSRWGRTPAGLRQIIVCAERVRFLARRGLLALLDSNTVDSKQWKSFLAARQRRVKSHSKARDAASGWIQKLPADEAASALAQARRFDQGGLAKYFQPAWWRLRRILRRCYNFRAHVVRPTWTDVLSRLEAEYRSEAAVEAADARMRETFRFDGPVEPFAQRLKAVRESLKSEPAPVRAFYRHLARLAPAEAGAAVDRLLEHQPALDGLRAELSEVLDAFEDLTFDELRDVLRGIDASLDRVPDFVECLSEIASLPGPLGDALRRLPLTPEELESASAARSLDEAFRADRELARFNGRVRAQHAARLHEACGRLYSVNAAHVLDEVRRRFVEHVRISSAPAAQLTREQKEFKKQYARGRRELEHEFGKSMRYKPIRDLATGETGMVVNDLKPVWLMSPLSVSDTLPLDADHFDVVIFDEASQITLEEAVPSLFRAAQTIVVGDEMQLPPTNFFSARRSEEDEPLEIEEEGEIVEYDLASNSFLNHAARNLPATMLGWHYRSRSEALIGFSNAAFYAGRLLTVPEETLNPPGRPPLDVKAPSEAEDRVADLLDRPISFHFLENGAYQARRNAAEADYIAHLVRGLLKRRTGLSLGIVAFSEAQQSEIDEALERLAGEDPEFRDLLEAEREREEEDQFLGLLVKNLENIQGDERDIVILSICYGPDAQGRMRMHFGPINQNGGEKRLNVAFSRAKCRMAVVSSIRAPAITNDYNDGANCLKNYLRYAEAVSTGNAAAAARVLDELSLARGDRVSAAAPADALTERLAAALQAEGCRVDRNVGQSRFRCDLAVHREGDRAYRLGVLVDTEDYHQQADLLERDVMRPRLLEAFGWRIAHVLAADWYADPAGVHAELLSAAAGDGEAVPRGA